MFVAVAAPSFASVTLPVESSSARPLTAHALLTPGANIACMVTRRISPAAGPAASHRPRTSRRTQPVCGVQFCHAGHWRRGWAGAALLSAVAPCAHAPCAHADPVPDTVSAPKAINLGSTSFFDGFGRTTEGWTLLEYGRFENLTRITTSQGSSNPLFKGTDIRVFVVQTQICYTSDWHPFGGDAVGISAMLPLAGFTSRFDQDSPVKLTNNGFGVGDLNIGPFYQSKYVMDAGKPVFAWRTQLSIIAPIGSVNDEKNINQGSGFWSINPYLAFTWLPLPKLEFSSRINYMYNFQTSAI